MTGHVVQCTCFWSQGVDNHGSAPLSRATIWLPERCRQQAFNWFPTALSTTGCGYLSLDCTISCVSGAPGLKSFAAPLRRHASHGEGRTCSRSRTSREAAPPAPNGTVSSAKPAHWHDALVRQDDRRNASKTPAVAPYGLKLQRYFTAPGDDGFANVEWELRTAAITGENGKMVFEQRDVEVPKSWSQTATNVVVQKYFRGIIGTPERERSVRQLISRVADTITNWGKKDGYFADDESARVFNAELKHLLVQQKMSFNSPVWFNVGIEAEPQCSACFINSVEDTMGSILTLAKTEGMLFKYGSGTGTNLSPIRSSKELLNGGGTASGPVSFMRGFDAFAGVIKSGGKTRRAAKMVILNIDHPDVDEFIWCKSKEEKKAWTLIDAGYDGSFDGEAYKSVFFQNSNNSVRVTDDFMEAVQKDREWVLRSPRDGSAVETVKARDLWRDIATAAWECGDPGLQYDTTVNAWHTSSAHGAHQRVQPVQRVHVPRRFGVQPRVAEPAQVRQPRRQRRTPASSTSSRSARRSRRRSSARRSSSATPSTRPTGSATTRTASGRWASATPTWARC